MVLLSNWQLSLSTMLLTANNTHAFTMSGVLNGLIVDEITTSRNLEEDAADTETEHGLHHRQLCDSVIITVFAWLVFAVASISCFVDRFSLEYL
jgi:hypothetical protein